jgi:hypothetical protein
VVNAIETTIELVTVDAIKAAVDAIEAVTVEASQVVTVEASQAVTVEASEAAVDAIRLQLMREMQLRLRWMRSRQRLMRSRL